MQIYKILSYLRLLFPLKEKKEYLYTQFLNLFMNKSKGAIGIFDSGYGGLSIFREIHKLLPEYDFVFLGDNARAPYGDRSFEEVFAFSDQAVKKLFELGCPLVIIACNTASAKALRTIQQVELPKSEDPSKRVLGVIRPTIERVADLSYSKHIGIIATQATISSESYILELNKYAPQITANTQACPRWVPLIEKGDLTSEELHNIVKEDIQTLLAKDSWIDTIVLGCTHYPLITSLIQRVLQELDLPEIILMPQGKPVAYSLKDYLKRHPEIEQRLTKESKVKYYTTGNVATFDKHASTFIGKDETVFSESIVLK